jgi:hypothetical protein
LSIKADYRVALGVPAVIAVGPVAGYCVLAIAGVGRELALDSATVGVAITALGILRGIHQAPQHTWSLEFGGMLGVVVAIIALMARSISLASNPGPLFFFAIASSAVLGYVLHRMLRRLARWPTSGELVPEPTPPSDPSRPG